MKTGLFYLFFFLANFVLFSCKFEARQDYPVQSITINPADSESTLFSEMFESVNYIPLNGDLLGEIQKIVFKNDHIYVASNLPGCITTYSLEGKQHFQFCNEGQAPGQYRAIRDFDINVPKNRIEILDRNNFMLLYYDLQGNFLGGVRHFLFANAFQRLDDERIGIYSGNEITQFNDTKLIVYNEKTQKVEKGFISIPRDMEQRYANFFDQNNFLTYQDSLLFFYSFNDTIYNFTKDNLTPRMHISFGGNSVPKDFLERGYQNVQVFMEQVRKTDYAFKIAGYQETESFITFIFEHAGRFKLAYYNKKNGKQKIAHNLQDDLLIKGLNLDNLRANGPYTTTGKGEVVFVVEAPVLKEAVLKYKNSMSTEEWEKLISSNEKLRNINIYLSESDNPVLLLVKYKGL